MPLDISPLHCVWSAGYARKRLLYKTKDTVSLSSDIFINICTYTWTIALSLIKPCPVWWVLTIAEFAPNSATVAKNGDCRRMTVAEFGDYNRQCGQGFTDKLLWRCHIFSACIWISLASPALRHVPPLDFQLLNFLGDFRAAQTLTFDFMWLPVQ